MALCKTCKKVYRQSQMNELPGNQGFLCDNCLEKGEEELDFDNAEDIDENVMQKAIQVTKEQREDN